MRSLILLLFFLWLNQSCNRKMIAYTETIDALPTAQFSPTKLKIHVFETGNMEGDAWGVYVGGKGKIDMDQPSFLIEHPDKGLLLFEAGFSPNVAKEGVNYVGKFLFHSGLLAMHQDLNQDVKSQLLHHGFHLDSIRYIIPSHFHPEHAGAIEEFETSTIMIDQRELDYIMERPKYNFLKKEFDEIEDWFIIPFVNNFQPFDGIYDVYGDGSVFIVSSPGHTPGHLSLLLNTEEGPIMLTGDVAWRMKNLTTNSIGLPFISVDGKAARKSLGKMKAFSQHHPDVLMVPGHDLNPLREAKRTDVILYSWGDKK